jgi:hypothetical protein
VIVEVAFVSTPCEERTAIGVVTEVDEEVEELEIVLESPSSSFTVSDEVLARVFAEVVLV